MFQGNSFNNARRALLHFAIIQIALSALILGYLNEPSAISDYPVSHIVLDSDGNLLNASLSAVDEWCIPVSLDKMGKWTAAAAIALEDKRFYRHHGVDPIALSRAVVSNIISGKRISGASTITSQLIRISHPRDRNYSTKAIEFWSAMRLEGNFSKKAILEAYLNRAPLGGNIRGVEAGARAYFNKSAKELSLAESTLLISLLRSPSRLRPDRYPTRAKEIRDIKIKYLFSIGIISGETMKTSLMEQVLPERYSMPRDVSMACVQIRKHTNEKSVIRSTINSKYQKLLEENLKQALSSMPERITGSAILIDNLSKSVVGYVGNVRHGSGLPASQVDCLAAPRSPGSTLKPFAYAATFDAGQLTPASLLADTPISFRGNAPRNYDLSFRGPVSVRTALSASLNTPAVRVLRMVGYPKTLSLYQQLGFKYFNEKPTHYADSLILGGCDVTAIELAAAYLTFARGGEYHTLNWVKSASSNSHKVFSSGASYMIRSILEDERRLIPLYQQLYKEDGERVAFKTGTSYGLRDAWCAGISAAHTLVVWFGDPTGRSYKELVGLDTAAPVLLKIFNELPKAKGKTARAPADIVTRKVCAVSGLLPSKQCRHIISDIAIKDVSSVAICNIHREIDGKFVTEWPPELSAWMQTRESQERDDAYVKITRPLKNSVIFLPENSVKARVFFSAEGNGELFWFLDGEFIGKDTAGKGIFADVSNGVHRISVMLGETVDLLDFKVVDPKEELKRQVMEQSIN